MAPVPVGTSVRIVYNEPSDVLISGAGTGTPPLARVRELRGQVVEDRPDTLRIRITGVKVNNESLYPWTGSVIAHAPRDSRSRVEVLKFNGGKTAKTGAAGIGIGVVLVAVGSLLALLIILDER